MYPDLWRLLGLPFLTTQPRDRGAAIDLDWKTQMLHPKTSMRHWVKPIQTGKLPIPVFNATIVEDGRRYLLSPMTFGLKPKQGLEFNRLYPNCDIDANTAALLSATFPYVTPVTRNSRYPQNKPIFHVADGGYFDNFGVVTAVDWLEKLVLNEDKQRTIKKVLFVEIRAFSDEPLLKTAKDQRVGWKMALFGPIFTIVGARNSTQSQRNADDIKALKDTWLTMGVTIDDFKISFPENVEFFALPTTGSDKINRLTEKLVPAKRKAEQYQPPLSWTLTKKQRLAIQKAWQTVLNDSESGAVKLINAWKKSH